MSVTLDTLAINHPDNYSRSGPPLAAWDLLRETTPNGVTTTVEG